MTTLTATVDRIQARADAVDWRRVLLIALMAIPFALGFTVRCVVRTVGWALAWAWAAGVEGWTAAGPKREAG